MEEIIIERKNNNVFVYVLENGEIVEKYDFSLNNNSTIGNIYIGTIKDIFDGMQAAFVDIGLDKNAFLSLKDAMEKIDIAKASKHEIEKESKLSHVVKKGQKILLQIRKEAYEDKGPRVSTHITLAGNYLVLMPDTNIITISQKIESVEEKERLFKIIKTELPENYGCIVRTDAVGIEAIDIVNDLELLLKTWKEIKKKFDTLKNKEFEVNIQEVKNQGQKNQEASNNDNLKLIYDDNQIAMKIARDMVRKTTKKIYVNDKKIYNELKQQLSMQAIDDFLIFKDKANFIENFGMQTSLDKVNDRKIWLKCGAHIVIDKTEALTAIDVNSSRCIGKDDLEKTIFKINQEAAIEIMKQLRLKDIGGIVIIDFIDMHNKSYKDEILRIMKEEQKKDRSKIDIRDFTALNLVEMTRKKMYV